MSDIPNHHKDVVDTRSPRALLCAQHLRYNYKLCPCLREHYLGLMRARIQSIRNPSRSVQQYYRALGLQRTQSQAQISIPRC